MDVSDPYLTRLPEDAGPRHSDLRELENGLRSLVHTGASWYMRPRDLPPGSIVYQQTPRWRAAGRFAAIVHDLRLLRRGLKGRKDHPGAALFDSRARPSPLEVTAYLDRVTRRLRGSEDAASSLRVHSSVVVDATDIAGALAHVAASLEEDEEVCALIAPGHSMAQGRASEEHVEHRTRAGMLVRLACEGKRHPVQRPGGAGT